MLFLNSKIKAITLAITTVIQIALFGQFNASFVASNDTACGQLLNVVFTDNSTGGSIDSRTWSIDGNPITETGNTFTTSFSQPGSYLVELAVTSSGQTYTYSKTMEVLTSPEVNFSTLNDRKGCENRLINFKDASTSNNGNIASWLWNFGDGNTSNEKDPGHSFSYHPTNGGKFDITLTVTDEKGCKSTGQIEDFVKASPGATINVEESNPLACSTPHNFEIEITTTGWGNSTIPFRYIWDFGDGNDIDVQDDQTHSVQNNYNNRGTYTITLSVIDSVGCQTNFQFEDYVNIDSIFTSIEMDSILCSGTVIHFDANNSKGIESWYFPELDTTVIDSVAQIIIDTNGEFQAIHSVTTGTAECIKKDTLLFSVKKMQLSFSADSVNACSGPFTVNFSSNVIPAQNNLTYTWNTFDQNTQNLQSAEGDSPTINYSQEGIYTVRAIVQDSFGCQDTFIQRDFITLVFPEPSFGISVDSGCVPLNVTFTDASSDDNGIVSHAWTFGDGNSSSSANTSNIYTTQDTFIVTLNITNGLGCTGGFSDTIRTGNKPNSNIPTFSDSFCYSTFEEIRMLNTSDAGSHYHIWYQSQDKDGNYFENKISQEAEFWFKSPDLADTGYYNITHVHSYNGCWDTSMHDSALYIKGPKASFYMVLNCDSSQYVEFHSTSVGGTDFFWDYGDGNTSTVEDSNHFYPITAQGLNYDLLFLIMDSITGCRDSVDNSFAPIRFPKANFEIPASAPCAPAAVNFTTNNTIDAVEYRWSFYGEDTSAFSSANSTGVNTFSNVGDYNIYLEIQDINGCKRDTSIPFHVTGADAYFFSDTLRNCLPFIDQFTDTSIADSAVYSRIWEVKGPNSLIWDSLGQDSIVNFNFNLVGLYDIRFNIQTVNGCSRSILKNDYIEVIKPTSKFFTNPGDRAICHLDSIRFTNLSTSSDNSDLTYSWDFSYDSLTHNSQSQEVSPYHTFEGNITGVDTNHVVQLIVTDTNGCSDSSSLSDTAIIETQRPVALFNTLSDTFFCAPAPVTFVNASLAQSVEEIRWDMALNDPSGGAPSTSISPTHTYLLPENYNVQMIVQTSAGCIDTITKLDHIIAKGAYAEIAYSQDPTICKGDSIIFRLVNAINVDSIAWNTQGNQLSNSPEQSISQLYFQSGTFFPSAVVQNPLLQVDDTLCLRAIEVSEDFSDSIVVQNPEARFELAANQACQPMILDITNNSTLDETYLWTFSGTETSTLETPNYTFSDSGTHIIELQIFTNLGCSDTAYDSVRVHLLPEVGISKGDTICYSKGMNLHGVGSGIRYFWTSSSDTFNVNSTTFLAVPDSTDWYIFHVIDSNNCYNRSEDSAHVYVIQRFNSQWEATITNRFNENFTGDEFNFDPIDSMVAGEKITTKITTESELPTSISWTQNGFLLSTSGDTATAIPTNIGEEKFYDMTITALVVDSMGCDSNILEYTVTVTDSNSFAMPDAFSPNGDGVNEIIYAKGAGIKNLEEFSIYNRWGELVFFTDNINEGWDGKVNGKVQNPDKYIFVIKGTFNSGENSTLKGSFLLVR